MPLPAPVIAAFSHFSGPVPEATSILAMAASAAIFAFSEPGTMQRRCMGLLFAIFILFSSAGFVPPMFGYPGPGIFLIAVLLSLLAIAIAALLLLFLAAPDHQPQHDTTPRPIRPDPPAARPAQRPRKPRTRQRKPASAAEEPVKRLRKSPRPAHPLAERWQMPPASPVAAPSSSPLGLPLDPALDETTVRGLFAPFALSDIETWTGIDDGDDSPDPDVAIADQWLKSHPRKPSGRA